MGKIYLGASVRGRSSEQQNVLYILESINLEFHASKYDIRPAFKYVMCRGGIDVKHRVSRHDLIATDREGPFVN